MARAFNWEVWGPWLGGYQYDKLAEPAGDWAWVTDEPWSYTNWWNGEPNNYGGNEDFLQFLYVDGKWNDISYNGPGYDSYVVEYDSYSGPFEPYNPAEPPPPPDGQVPEPTTLIIWSLLGSLAIGVGWWRRRRAA